MSEPPSGKQFTLASGKHRAVIVEVGGGIRSYTVDDRDLLDGYDVQAMCTGARGLPLIPWPNRVEDGVYSFAGVDHQLALTEPTQHNAIHGLLRDRNWTVLDHQGDRIAMRTVLHPCQGYPFALEGTVEYTLNGVGLTVRTTATNIGDSPCPYGTGHHPYLFVGTDSVDECVLQVPGERWLPTDDRGLPTGTEPVAGSPYDYRSARTIGDQEIDFTFTNLRRDGNGLAWVRLTADGDRGVELWLDSSYPYVEIYTSHTQPSPHYRRGLGVEPMTCAPNAYRNGDGLQRLQPGETTSSRWGVQPA